MMLPYGERQLASRPAPCQCVPILAMVEVDAATSDCEQGNGAVAMLGADQCEHSCLQQVRLQHGLERRPKLFGPAVYPWRRAAPQQSPQVHLYAQGAILLFMVLGWSLIWMKDVSFPNLLATYLDFYLSWLCILYCTVHTILYSTVKGYKREGVSQIFFFSFETSVHTGKFVFYGAMVCHSNIFSVSY